MEPFKDLLVLLFVTFTKGIESRTGKLYIVSARRSAVLLLSSFGSVYRKSMHILPNKVSETMKVKNYSLDTRTENSMTGIYSLKISTCRIMGLTTSAAQTQKCFSSGN
jgi:hypothetical protein